MSTISISCDQIGRQVRKRQCPTKGAVPSHHVKEPPKKEFRSTGGSLNGYNRSAFCLGHSGGKKRTELPWSMPFILGRPGLHFLRGHIRRWRIRGFFVEDCRI